jgi:hypothetical protein
MTRTIDTEALISEDGRISIQSTAPQDIQPGLWSARLLLDDRTAELPTREVPPFKITARPLGGVRPEWGALSLKEIEAAMEAEEFLSSGDRSSQ